MSFFHHSNENSHSIFTMAAKEAFGFLSSSKSGKLLAPVLEYGRVLGWFFFSVMPRNITFLRAKSITKLNLNFPFHRNLCNVHSILLTF